MKVDTPIAQYVSPLLRDTGHRLFDDAVPAYKCNKIVSCVENPLAIPE